MSRIVHFEIPANDPKKMIDFFVRVFDWRFKQFGQSEYWIIETGEHEEKGINGAMMKKVHPQQPLTHDIQVDNIDEAIKLIESHGGAMIVPKTELPGVGWRAFFKDPEGNLHGLWQSAKSN